MHTRTLGLEVPRAQWLGKELMVATLLHNLSSVRMPCLVEGKWCIRIRDSLSSSKCTRMPKTKSILSTLHHNNSTKIWIWKSWKTSREPCSFISRSTSRKLPSKPNQSNREHLRFQGNPRAPLTQSKLQQRNREPTQLRTTHLLEVKNNEQMKVCVGNF